MEDTVIIQVRSQEYLDQGGGRWCEVCKEEGALSNLFYQASNTLITSQKGDYKKTISQYLWMNMGEKILNKILAH